MVSQKLVQAMLCKVGSQYSVSANKQVYGVTAEKNSLTQWVLEYFDEIGYQVKKLKYNYAAKKGSYKIEYQMKRLKGSVSGDLSKFGAYIDGTDYFQTTQNVTSYTSYNTTLNLTTDQNILFFAIWTGWTDANYAISTYIQQFKITLLNYLLDKTGKKLIPIETKNIWINTTAISFGRLPNGVRWDGN